MKTHFCTCPDTTCTMHPANHAFGCDPCVRSNVLKMEMPTCFFLAIHDDKSAIADTSFEGFVNFFLAHRDEYLARKNK
ncbi:MAG: DUF6485 family protein [Planctomycetes bacterium]|nr:DUF6485 family protein [Planctomycetota bacterium]